MHIHFRQHFTKHFVHVGTDVLVMILFTITNLSRLNTRYTRGRQEPLSPLPNVCRLGAFGACIPTLDKEGRHTMSYQHMTEVAIPRKSVEERLGRPSNVSRIQTSEPPTELQRLEAQADWHDREAAIYREKTPLRTLVTNGH